MNSLPVALPDEGHSDAVIFRPERPRLLVVHDQTEVIQSLYQVLGRDSQVFMTTRLDQAMPMCLQHMPDLLLVNAAMPEGDGTDVCRQVKADERTRHIPVLVLTAADDARQEVLALKEGAADCLSQPLNPLLVKARVDTHLALRHQAELLRNWMELDPVTGLTNRKRFERQLSIEWRRAVRSGDSLTLIRMGVDGLDDWRTLAGTAAADSALRQMADVLRGKLQRPGDLVCVVDKDLFACLLPDTAWPQGLTLARELQQLLRDAVLERPGQPRVGHVLTSMGVAVRSRDSQGSMASLVALADARLRDARRMGGDHALGVHLP